MKKTLIYLAAAALLAGCRGGGAGSLQRKNQPNYDVVQEGQASGVTSTINAPGEVAPPSATTTNLTLTGVAPTATQTNLPGTLGGSTQVPPPDGTAVRDDPTHPPPTTDTAPPPST